VTLAIAQISTQDALTQNLGTGVGGSSHMHRFGRDNMFTAVDEEVAFTGYPVRVNLASPLAFVPNHQNVSRHQKAPSDMSAKRPLPTITGEFAQQLTPALAQIARAVVLLRVLDTIGID
jgi:hypothetical protein